MSANKHNPFAAITDRKPRSRWFKPEDKELFLVAMVVWVSNFCALWQFLPFIPSLVVSGAVIVNLCFWNELKRG